MTSRLNELLEVREEGREAGSGVTGMRQEREEAEVVTENLLREESSSAEYFVAKMISISVQFQDRKYFIPPNCPSINGQFSIFYLE